MIFCEIVKIADPVTHHLCSRMYGVGSDREIGERRGLRIGGEILGRRADTAAHLTTNSSMRLLLSQLLGEAIRTARLHRCRGALGAGKAGEALPAHHHVVCHPLPPFSHLHCDASGQASACVALFPRASIAGPGGRGNALRCFLRCIQRIDGIIIIILSSGGGSGYCC